MNIIRRLDMWRRLLRYRMRDERAELRYLFGREFEGGSVFDVGAHRGEYSYWMHRRFTEGTRVVAFEPQPELARKLEDFKHAFQLDRMLIEPLGLSSQKGMLKMRRPRKRWGAATVDPFCNGDEAADEFDVVVTTIDDYLAEHPQLRPVRFIKCDVECHDAEVLAGAARTLREDRPEIIFEWSTPRRAYRQRIMRLAQQLGYAIFQFEYGGLTPCTSLERNYPPSWELGANYLMLPSGQGAEAATT